MKQIRGKCPGLDIRFGYRPQRSFEMDIRFSAKCKAYRKRTINVCYYECNIQLNFFLVIKALHSGRRFKQVAVSWCQLRIDCPRFSWTPFQWPVLCIG